MTWIDMKQNTVHRPGTCISLSRNYYALYDDWTWERVYRAAILVKLFYTLRVSSSLHTLYAWIKASQAENVLQSYSKMHFSHFRSVCASLCLQLMLSARSSLGLQQCIKAIRFTTSRVLLEISKPENSSFFISSSASSLWKHAPPKKEKPCLALIVNNKG